MNRYVVVDFSIEISRRVDSAQKKTFFLKLRKLTIYRKSLFLHKKKKFIKVNEIRYELIRVIEY